MLPSSFLEIAHWESIDRQIKALEQVQYSEDDVIRFKLQGKTLLSHPDKAWQQADSNTKKIIFNFIFEENLKVIDGKIGNTKYSLPYRVLKGKTSSSGGLVELRGIEPRTSWMPFKRSPSWAIAPLWTDIII